MTHRSIRHYAMCGALALAAICARSAAAAPHDACTASAFRGFDYMVGKWDIIDAGKGEVDGHTTIAQIEDGCALLEEFNGVTGRTGRAWNTYNPITNEWTQDFVGLGVRTHTVGKLIGSVMNQYGYITYLNTPVTHPFKGYWKPLPDGNVDNVYYEQDPKTSKWRVWFHTLYKKAA